MEGNEESFNAKKYSKITIIGMALNTEDNMQQKSMTVFATKKIYIQYCPNEMEGICKEKFNKVLLRDTTLVAMGYTDYAVIHSNMIAVNRNKFDKNPILLYGVLERELGQEETGSIVAILSVANTYLNLEDMSQSEVHKKTLNEFHEVHALGIDEASTECAYYLLLRETRKYNRVHEIVLPSLAAYDLAFLSINIFLPNQINGFSKRKDDMYNMYEALKKKQVINENLKKNLMEDIGKKNDLLEDLILTSSKYKGDELLQLVEDVHMKSVKKSEESELLTKNSVSCAISSESLSNLSTTSHRKITRQNVSKKSNKGTKELVNYVDKCITRIINQYIYPSKTTSHIPAILETLTHLNEQKRTRTSAGNFSSHETKYRHDRASRIPATLETPNHLNEQKGTRTSADNFTTRGTKIRHHSATTTYSRRPEQDSFRKSLMMQTLISLEQLRESLVNVKYPHYIWPSGHPLILSKLRQIELDFSSNEYLERLYSFVNGINRRHRTWNSDQIVRPDPMVLAGFSYDGEDDKVVCKSCGAISDVNDWSDDDEDYAFSKHREAANGPCEFLRTFDGEAQRTQAERSLVVNTVQCNPKYCDGIFLLTMDDEKDSDKKLSICEMIEKCCKRLLRRTNLFWQKNFSL